MQQNDSLADGYRHRPTPCCLPRGIGLLLHHQSRLLCGQRGLPRGCVILCRRLSRTGRWFAQGIPQARREHCKMTLLILLCGQHRTGRGAPPRGWEVHPACPWRGWGWETLELFLLWRVGGLGWSRGRPWAPEGHGRRELSVGAGQAVDVLPQHYPTANTPSSAYQSSRRCVADVLICCTRSLSLWRRRFNRKGERSE